MSACSPQLRSTASNGGALATEPIRRQYQQLIQVPPACRSGPQPTEVAGEHGAELQDPAPNDLVRALDAALGQELLHIAVAEREPEVEPRCVPDDLGRKLVAGVGEGRLPLPYPHRIRAAVTALWFP